MTAATTSGGTSARAEANAATSRVSAAALDDSLFLAVVLSWSAAAIHVVAAYEHAGEAASHAIFFTLLAVGQVAWGIAVYRRVEESVLAAGAVLSLLVVAVWVVSRTTGLPVGPEAGTPEAAGAIDIAATGSEIALALLVACRLGMDRGMEVAQKMRTPAIVAGVFFVLLSVVALTGGGGHAH